MKALPLALLALATSGLTGCDSAPGNRQVLRVVSGYVVPPVSPDRPAAGYFTVEGGGAPVDLVAVTADLAQRVEMHESVRENGMTSMRELLRAPVPVQGKLEFKPGGNHLMIWNINGAALRAKYLPTVFVFSNNDRIVFDLKIVAPNSAAKGDEAHKGH